VWVGESARWGCLLDPESAANGVRVSRSLASTSFTLWIVLDRHCTEHIVISILVTSELTALDTVSKGMGVVSTHRAAGVISIAIGRGLVPSVVAS